MNCKNGDVASFGDCVGSASRALCGLTEAAGQVKDAQPNNFFSRLFPLMTAGVRPRRQPTWLVCLIPTVRLDIRGWWTQSSLPKLTRQSRWPVRTWLTQRAAPPRYTKGFGEPKGLGLG